MTDRKTAEGLLAYIKESVTPFHAVRAAKNFFSVGVEYGIIEHNFLTSRYHFPVEGFTFGYKRFDFLDGCKVLLSTRQVSHGILPLREWNFAFLHPAQV